MRMRSGAWLALGMLGLVLLASGPADAQKKTLTIALNQDPDVLDRRSHGPTSDGSCSQACARSSTRSTRT
jgi:hypothetical protein